MTRAQETQIAQPGMNGAFGAFGAQSYESLRALDLEKGQKARDERSSLALQ